MFRTIPGDKVVKIWFSKPGTLFPLGNNNIQSELNITRLREHRQKFPNDTIALVSNYQDFSEGARKVLIGFCKEVSIQLIDFNSIEQKIKDCKATDKETQLTLFEIAKTEISLSILGLVAASDIARILTPISELGIYCDLDDIKIKSFGKPENIFGLLLYTKLRFGFEEERDLKGKNVVFCNEDVSITCVNGNNTPIFCDESKSSFFSEYRRLILWHYTTSEGFNSIFDKIKALEGNPLELSKMDKIKEKTYEMSQVTNKAKIKNLFPILMREYLKESWEEIGLSTVFRDHLLKVCIMFTAGPNCMQKLLNSFLTNVFMPYYEKESPKMKSFEYEDKKLFHLLGKFLIEDGSTFHQSDTSWLPSLDDTEKNYSKYYKNVSVNNNKDAIVASSSSSNSPGKTIIFREAVVVAPSGNNNLLEKLNDLYKGPWKEKKEDGKESIFWIRLSFDEINKIKDELDSIGNGKIKYNYGKVEGKEDYSIQIRESELNSFFERYTCKM